jgi:hypothetical protein
MCGMAVPEIVEPDSRQMVMAQEGLEGADDGAGPDRLTILAHTYVMVLGQPDAETKKPLGLLSAMTAQLGDHQRRQSNGAPLAILW